MHTQPEQPHHPVLPQPKTWRLCQLLAARFPWRRQQCLLRLHQQSPEGGALQQSADQRMSRLDMTMTCDPSPDLFVPRPSVPTLLARWFLLEASSHIFGSGGRGDVCHGLQVLDTHTLIPTSPCTICPDHKHICLSMAQPLWFSVQYRCVSVCVYAPCALYKKVSFSLHACVNAWTFSLVLITRKVWWWSKVLAKLNKVKHFNQ